MKHSVYLGVMLLTAIGQSVFAKELSSQTNLCIMNTTSASHSINVANIDNFDWDGDSRPDKNFTGLSISPGATLCRREEVNYWAQANFTFLIDGAPTRMRYLPTEMSEGADGKPTYSNKQWFADENSLYGEKTIWFQPGDYKLGYDCSSGQKCRLFEIR